MSTDPDKRRPNIPGRRRRAPQKPNDEPDLKEYYPLFPRTPEERKPGTAHIWGPARLAERAGNDGVPLPPPTDELPPEPPPAS
ncbi:unnamed protein product [Gemmataceae bacterium]|nr:unnamed protein product [Gemmataceae bacterium]VTT97330.1 unnamed protein product [Gemmataceae bacterium]